MGMSQSEIFRDMEGTFGGQSHPTVAIRRRRLRAGRSGDAAAP